MAITAQEIADALNAVGIDTPAELAEWAKTLSNKGPELEKFKGYLTILDERWQADLNGRQQRVDELRGLLVAAIRELEDGLDPTGTLPTPAQVAEVAPATPFEPTP